MVSFHLKHIQALHNLSQLPVLVLSQNLELLQAYDDEERRFPYYELIKTLDIPSNTELSCYEGMLEEASLIFPIGDKFIFIGPFYTSSFQDCYKEELADSFLKHSPDTSKQELIDYISTIPHFPASHIRSLLITVDAFFDTNFEMDCQRFINHLLEEPQIIANLELENTPSFHVPTVLNYLNHIIDLVKLGNTELLKKEINCIPASDVISSSISALRAEKNLSMIYFTKLLELSFTENTDVAKNYERIKHFMNLTEKAPDLLKVLQIRAAAIISLSESLTNKSVSDKQQIYNSILYYVDKHLYSKLKVSDIAKHLYISESHLRAVFKMYSSISLQTYILKEKVQEAKLLLRRGVPAGEVAKLLYFYDTTHFLKTFKKYTDTTPHEYLAHYQQSITK
ncbi:YSIRK-targeted surface antigen transcriptional regulator [Streptococcus equi subsp. zooepidemicus]|uniref:YSIRK-targeted surface antigen transcriptional regulator n=1 Tax=Streptococcus equi TaxID=1336 RepID=UPI00294A9D3B|nr:YSIRK-targeted surface antigen transcriptional regulator [Streptococcus equi]WOK57115.1 YSIRK-targeted surface antigen transcriptional regulator [Streptococcus equi subsp. zooepidemicus]